MALIPNNQLQNVALFIPAELAVLLNDYCAVSLTNKKYEAFNTDFEGNLGDTITWGLTPRYISADGLEVTDQPSVQRPISLVCSQAANVTSAFTDQQFIFNAETYMDKFGEGAMAEIGTKIESDVLKNVTSSVVNQNKDDPDFGTKQTFSGPYRFYGDGVNPLNSYPILAQALANFRAIGFAKSKLRAIIPQNIVPQIIGTGQNEFALTRNNRDAKDWELGPFSQCEWHQSNLLPVHIAGDIGNATAPNNILTVVSTNDPTGKNITQITATEPTGSTNPNAVKSGDMAYFIWGVPGKPNLYTLTFVGHILTQQQVQFLITEDAATVAGTVTLTLRTATGVGLCSAQTQNRNLSDIIQPGMKILILPSHQSGLIWSGDQFYMAMPKLPSEDPWKTVSVRDEETGVSIRHYWGALNGKNKRRYVRDAVWGSLLVPENCMRLIFPLIQ